MLELANPLIALAKMSGKCSKHAQWSFVLGQRKIIQCNYNDAFSISQWLLGIFAIYSGWWNLQKIPVQSSQYECSCYVHAQKEFKHFANIHLNLLMLKQQTTTGNHKFSV